MRAILCLAIWFASCAVADEVSDRASIDRVVSGLDRGYQGLPPLTADFSNFPELARLAARTPASLTVPSLPPGPAVVISHEPWGEATLVFPGQEGVPGTLAIAVQKSHLVIHAIRFVTPDVAVVDVTGESTGAAGTPETIPSLFVMKKEGANWKIASVRILSQS